MATKRAYRRTPVKDVSAESLEKIAAVKGNAELTVGLDVAKEEIVAVVRWGDGSHERPWSVSNPAEIRELIARLCQLKRLCGDLKVGLESTGTYSEAVRYALTQAEIEVHRVSGKGVSDYKEVFDGVPSQHDGKDAAVIAELVCFGKGTPWPFTPLGETEQRMRHQVARSDAFRKQLNQWICRVEGLLGRHWPELSQHLAVSRVTLLKICDHYGCPGRLAADKSARKQLRCWGGGQLSASKIEAVIESAKTTLGVPMSPSEIAWLQEAAAEALRAREEVKACEGELRLLAEQDENIQGFVGPVGVVTLCVLWAIVGDPANFSSSGAYLKALGLNLKELSSGKRKGELAISKRGSGLARRYLFFWALRATKLPELKNWYAGFQKVGQGTSKHRKMKGLVALMRKLARALWYCRKRNISFDYAKVFPGKPLEPRRSRRNRRRPINA